MKDIDLFEEYIMPNIVGLQKEYSVCKDGVFYVEKVIFDFMDTELMGSMLENLASDGYARKIIFDLFENEKFVSGLNNEQKRTFDKFETLFGASVLLWAAKNNTSSFFQKYVDDKKYLNALKNSHLFYVEDDVIDIIECNLSKINRNNAANYFYFYPDKVFPLLEKQNFSHTELNDIFYKLVKKVNKEAEFRASETCKNLSEIAKKEDILGEDDEIWSLNYKIYKKLISENMPWTVLNNIDYNINDRMAVNVSNFFNFPEFKLKMLEKKEEISENFAKAFLKKSTNEELCSFLKEKFEQKPEQKM